MSLVRICRTWSPRLPGSVLFRRQQWTPSAMEGLHDGSPVASPWFPSLWCGSQTPRVRDPTPKQTSVWIQSEYAIPAQESVQAVTRTPVRAVRVQAYVRIGSRTIRSTRFIAMIPAVYICKLTSLFHSNSSRSPLSLVPAPSRPAPSAQILVRPQ